jgi:hypothetical protein
MNVLNSKYLSLTEKQAWIEQEILSNAGTPKRIRENCLSAFDIKIKPEVFQMRVSNNEDDIIDSHTHIQNLTEILREEDLDPVVIYTIGSEYYLIEGHHRYQAYMATLHMEKPRIGKVPVILFKGSPKEAILHGMKVNNKDKLNTSKEQKLEQAWSIIRNKDNLSIKETHLLTGIATRTISNMREHVKENGETPLFWRDTKKTSSQGSPSDRTRFSRDLEKLLSNPFPKEARNIAVTLKDVLGAPRFQALTEEINSINMPMQDRI